MPDSALNTRAKDLLTKTPLVDGHNDLPWALRKILGGADASRIGEFALSTDVSADFPALQTDFARARAGGLSVQFWSVFVPCAFTGHEAVTATCEQIELAHAMIEHFTDDLSYATTAAQVREAFDQGKIASLLGAEGGHSIANSLTILRVLYRLGVRYLTLTHNENTDWADSATDEPRHGGLTDFGRDVVREMNSLGMIVDLSHVAETTMRDALEVTKAPVLFSHSCAKTVTDSPRNVPDDVLKTMAGSGGVCMLSFVPAFVSQRVTEWEREVRAAMGQAGENYRDLTTRRAFVERWDGPPAPKATLQDVVAHIEHVRDVAGVEHIGLGGDYDGVVEQPAGLADVRGYPNLFAELLDRGWSDDDCRKLAGENALRVLADVESVALGLSG